MKVFPITSQKLSFDHPYRAKAVIHSSVLCEQVSSVDGCGESLLELLELCEEGRHSDLVYAEFTSREIDIHSDNTPQPRKVITTSSMSSIHVRYNV